MPLLKNVSLRQFVQDAYERYGPSLKRRALLILGNEAEAKDALQNTFVKLITEINRGRMNPEELSMAWLYRVTTNTCLNMKRKTGRIVYSDAYLDVCKSDQRDVNQMIALNQLLDEMSGQLKALAVYRQRRRPSRASRQQTE